MLCQNRRSSILWPISKVQSKSHCHRNNDQPEPAKSHCQPTLRNPMRVERIIYSLLIILTTGLAAVNWRKANLFQQDNEQMRAKLEQAESELARKEGEATNAT